MDSRQARQEEGQQVPVDLPVGQAPPEGHVRPAGPDDRRNRHGRAPAAQVLAQDDPNPLTSNAIVTRACGTVTRDGSEWVPCLLRVQKFMTVMNFCTRIV